MSGAIDISAISLTNGMKTLEWVGHNIANASVTGYKSQRIINSPGRFNFNDHLQRAANFQLDAAIAPVVTNSVNLTGGSLQETGNPLHLGIEGDGFFAVQTPDGVAYSRSGAFAIDSQGRLVLHDIFPVLGESGEIVLTSHTPKITQTGEIYDNEKLIDRLKLVFPAAHNAFEAYGKNLFLSPTLPSEERTNSLYALRQGFLESSNVDQLDEMITMMKINRQVEMSQRIIRGYDEMIGSAISSIAEF